MPGINRGVHIGCAGWSLSGEHLAQFIDGGTHLERYAARFNCVEINSSFYRSHRTATYERWANLTPDKFRFAVKLSKQITHFARLKDSGEAIDRFSAEVSGLGSKLGAVLVQLPPSLKLDRRVAKPFFKRLAGALPCALAVEPRHASWFDSAATSLLAELGVGRVTADPAVVAGAGKPIAGKGLAYYRWHGSPRIYYSSYDDQQLSELAQSLIAAVAQTPQVWCIFDNTAAGAATANALSLLKHVGEQPVASSGAK